MHRLVKVLIEEDKDTNIEWQRAMGCMRWRCQNGDTVFTCEANCLNRDVAEMIIGDWKSWDLFGWMRILDRMLQHS